MERERHFVAAFLIRRPDNKIFLVQKGSKTTIPTEHFEIESEDSLKETAYRGIKEELGIEPEEISFEESLGTLMRYKDNPSLRKLMEILSFEVSFRVAKKIEFTESRYFWIDLREASKLSSLDELAAEGITRYLRKHPYRATFWKLPVLLWNLRRELRWKEKNICKVNCQ